MNCMSCGHALVEGAACPVCTPPMSLPFEPAAEPATSAVAAAGEPPAEALRWMPDTARGRAALLLWASIVAGAVHTLWSGFTLPNILGAVAMPLLSVYAVLAVQRGFAVGRDLLALGFAATAAFNFHAWFFLKQDIGVATLITGAATMGALYILFSAAGRRELRYVPAPERDGTLDLGRGLGKALILLGFLVEVGFVFAKPVPAIHLIVAGLALVTQLYLLVHLAGNATWATSAIILFNASLIVIGAVTSHGPLVWTSITLYAMTLKILAVLAGMHVLASTQSPTVHRTDEQGLCMDRKLLKAVTVATAMIYAGALMVALRASMPG